MEKAVKKASNCILRCVEHPLPDVDHLGDAANSIDHLHPATHPTGKFSRAFHITGLCWTAGTSHPAEIFDGACCHPTGHQEEADHLGYGTGISHPTGHQEEADHLGSGTGASHPTGHQEEADHLGYVTGSSHPTGHQDEADHLGYVTGSSHPTGHQEEADHLGSGTEISHPTGHQEQADHLGCLTGASHPTGHQEEADHLGYVTGSSHPTGHKEEADHLGYVTGASHPTGHQDEADHLGYTTGPSHPIGHQDETDHLGYVTGVCHPTGYLKETDHLCAYYSHSYMREFLLLAGDIESNPGPAKSGKNRTFSPLHNYMTQPQLSAGDKETNNSPSTAIQQKLTKKQRQLLRKEKDRIRKQKVSLKEFKKEKQSLDTKDTVKIEHFEPVIVDLSNTVPEYELAAVSTDIIQSTFQMDLFELTSPAAVILGHFSQADQRFGTSHGQQCTCNGITMLCVLQTNNNVTKDVIDATLYEGDKVFRELSFLLRQTGMSSQQFRYLEFREIELLSPLKIFDCQYTIKLSECMSGALHSVTTSDRSIYALSDAISMALSQKQQALMMIESYAMALVKTSGMVGLFDSHTHSEDGSFNVADGCAAFMLFKNETLTANFLKHNFPSHCQYDIYPVDGTQSFEVCTYCICHVQDITGEHLVLDKIFFRQYMMYLLGNKGAHIYNGNIFSCSACGQSYKSEKTLQNHKCPHCQSCKKTFSTWQRYTSHKCHSESTTSKNPVQVLASTSVDTLCEHVGGINHLIPDDVISFMLNLIRRDYSNINVGALLPAEVEIHLVSTKRPPPCVPVDTHAVNIHYTNQHWITSWQDPCDRKVKVYDSLHNSNRIPTILPALKLFYNLSHFKVEYPHCASQQSEPVCGAYSVAFAVLCAQHISPENTVFEESQLRMHLKTCIKNSVVQMFPTVTRPIQIPYFSSQNLVQKEFARQALWQQQHAKKKEELQQSGKKDTQRKTARERKSLSRHNQPETVREKQKAADKARKSLQRQTLSPEEKAIHKQKDRMRKRHSTDGTHSELEKTKWRKQKAEQRKKMTAEQKEEVSQKQRKQKAAKRKQMTTEQREEISQKQRKQKAAIRKQMTTEQREEVSQKQKKQKADQRKQMTKEQRGEVSEKHRKQMAEHRRKMTVEQREEVSQKQRKQMAQQRKQMPKKQREEVSQKQRKQKALKRRTGSVHQKQISRQKDQGRKHQKRHPSEVAATIKLFWQNIGTAPIFICTCCHRQMYKESCFEFQRKNYKASDTFLKNSTTGLKSARNKEWICKTCHRQFGKQCIPVQCVSNKLEVYQMPDELKSLTSLEARLLAKRYPFMKIVSLPRGKQPGIRGGVVNVPVAANKVCESLPRTPRQAGIIPIKLKRKLSYKNYVSYQHIRPEAVRVAFQKLKVINKFYTGVTVNDEWEEESRREDPETWQGLAGITEPENAQKEKDDGIQASMENIRKEHSSEIPPNSSEETLEKNLSSSDKEQCVPDKEQGVPGNSEDNDPEEDLDPVAQLRGVKFDTCVLPSDPSLNTEGIYNVAPGEGRKPLAIMMDEFCEEQAFPQLFPTGQFGFQATRAIKLTPKKYFVSRLMNKDPRFASNVEYLFFAQYICEYKQVMDNISIALRKGRLHTAEGERVTAGMLNDPERLKNIIFKDKAYNILQTVRGSPPYWQKVMYKLLAAVKQLGLFTWFLTLSAADLRWPDTLQTIAKQQGRILSEEDVQNMTWEEKCKLLASNPVTAARHFDHRLQCFFRDILLSRSEPLGHIEYYMYRIEFQQRGSPHAHCVLWVKGAPAHDDNEDILRNFIDRYVTCILPTPEEDEQMNKLVSELQRHTHSASCRKSGKKCRFNYPRPVAPLTVVASPPETDDPEEDKKLLESSLEIMTKVKEVMEKEEGVATWTVQEVLEKAGVTEESYLQALRINKKGKSIIYQRTPEEININTYNPTVLRAWQANMDLQFVCNAYACIHYIISYVTKDEREMGQALREVSKSMGDMNVRQKMKQVANCFLNAREVSAQEAVYRVLGLDLYSSNFRTVFIPTDLPENRVVFLKPKVVLETMEADREDVAAQTLPDRYAHRPKDLESLTLAEFARWYEVLGENKKQKNEAAGLTDCQPNLLEPEKKTRKKQKPKIPLLDGRGYIRKSDKPYIIRYHKFSETKDQEKYCHHMLMLYHPWRDEESDLKNGHDSYSQHYEQIQANIQGKQAELENFADIIEDAIQEEQTIGPPVHSWDTLDTEAQHEDVMAEGEGEVPDPDNILLEPDPQHVADPEHIAAADVPLSASYSTHFAVDHRPGFLSDEQYQHLVQSLNTHQRIVYDHLLNWCTQITKSRKAGSKPKPLHIFVTGGAGTGKSHVIQAIHQMAIRTLQYEGENPDNVKVLLTAPTGTAAFNIGGHTLHSVFLLPLGQTKSYLKLSDEKRNTLRMKLQELEILIIDEVSMVGTDLLRTLDQRLREIKGIDEIFGRVTVLAFGDLFQLAPVAQKFVFELVTDEYDRLAGSVWQENFRIIELEEIMRQKEDRIFAEVLNRLRLGKHDDTDEETFRKRVISQQDPNYPQSALHVFGTNEKVDEHNKKKLGELPTIPRKLVAHDKKPSVLKRYKPKSDPKFTGGLPEVLYLSVGARVMLTRNLDVTDGLVNGALGTIVEFLEYNPPRTQPAAILVQFDQGNVGVSARQSTAFNISHFPSAVPIGVIDAKFTISGKKAGMEITRQQFPLRLCWATTIHKVQGLTVKKIVVSMEGKMADGQVYVAFSRVPSQSSLYLQDFDAKKLKSSAKVKAELERLHQEMPLQTYHSEIQAVLHATPDPIFIAVHNVRSLPKHFRDIILQSHLKSCTAVCFTETWLTSSHSSSTFAIPDYNMVRCDRQGAAGGGLATYVKTSVAFELQDLPIDCTGIEVQCMELQIPLHDKLYIATVYRHPSSSLSVFNNAFCNLLRALASRNKPTVIVGDFNINLLSATHAASVQQELHKQGFKQYVKHATHISGSLLDHVYSNVNLAVWQAASYYSDHDILFITYTS